MLGLTAMTTRDSRLASFVSTSGMSQIQTAPVVFVVDDDPNVRRSVCRLLRANGLRTESFSSAAEFLRAEPETSSGCLLLDVQMPDMSGLALQELLVESDSPYPIVFMTGHGDVPESVRAMKSGAVDYLQKPVEEATLLSAVQRGLTLHAVLLEQARWRKGVRERLDRLTPRELEVMELVAAGHRNRDVADILGISEPTVKVHRGRVMRKLQVDSVPELVRIAAERERRQSAAERNWDLPIPGRMGTA